MGAMVHEAITVLGEAEAQDRPGMEQRRKCHQLWRRRASAHRSMVPQGSAGGPRWCGASRGSRTTEAKVAANSRTPTGSLTATCSTTGP